MAESLRLRFASDAGGERPPPLWPAWPRPSLQSLAPALLAGLIAAMAGFGLWPRWQQLNALEGAIQVHQTALRTAETAARAMRVRRHLASEHPASAGEASRAQAPLSVSERVLDLQKSAAEAELEVLGLRPEQGPAASAVMSVELRGSFNAIGTWLTQQVRTQPWLIRELRWQSDSQSMAGDRVALVLSQRTPEIRLPDGAAAAFSWPQHGIDPFATTLSPRVNERSLESRGSTYPRVRLLGTLGIPGRLIALIDGRHGEVQAVTVGDSVFDGGWRVERVSDDEVLLSRGGQRLRVPMVGSDRRNDDIGRGP